MEAENLWRCFLETGAPEYYLLYKAAKIPGFCEFKTIKSGGNPCT